MVIRAVGFDIGGVLEHVEPQDAFERRWQQRLGLSEDEYAAAVATVDRGGATGVGGMTEAEFSRRYAAALGLSSAQAGEFMADLWDWYCGELDVELTEFAASLRPAYRTGILSNSADGARREEQARYGFEQLVDVLVYSHEAGVEKPDPRSFQLLCQQLGVAPAEMIFLDDVPGHIAAATELGIHGVLHVSTADSIAASETLLRQGS
jgi:epoxide hydrolase-like predicted phosphatase